MRLPAYFALALCLALATSGSGRAQVLSTWGHPVITFGQTPYHAVSTGHGNYPGSDGFIPGYGYYPGDLPGHYPWLDGPGTPFDRRRLGAFAPLGLPDAPGMPSQVQEPLVPGSARLVVKLPADAELFFDDVPTSQRGSYRVFTTPRLPDDSQVSYTIRVRWRIKDAELGRVERVPVAPGRIVTINLLTVDGWSGQRLPAESDMLPAPKQLPAKAADKGD